MLVRHADPARAAAACLAICAPHVATTAVFAHVGTYRDGDGPPPEPLGPQRL